MKIFKLGVLAFLVLALAVPATAFAAGPTDGRVVIGGTYDLASGQVLSGDLVVIGGAATLHSGSRVTGDAALIGGVLNAAGEVDGDIFALGGIVTLGAEAVVHGDLVTIGAVVNRAEGSRVEGQVTEGAFAEGFNLTLPGIVLPSDVGRFEVPLLVRGFRPVNVLFDIGWAILKALLMAGLAVLVVLFWPERTARVARTAMAQPVVAFLIGLVTAFFGVTLIVVLAITICLSPISLIGGLLLGAAVILGWVAIGLEIGWRMAQAFKRDWHPATQAGLGTLVLSLAVAAIGVIPCLGGIFGAMLWMLGLGAVLMTRFGGQDSPGPTAVQAV
jgi:hypothetical protein